MCKGAVGVMIFQLMLLAAGRRSAPMGLSRDEHPGSVILCGDGARAQPHSWPGVLLVAFFAVEQELC